MTGHDKSPPWAIGMTQSQRHLAIRKIAGTPAGVAFAARLAAIPPEESAAELHDLFHMGRVGDLTDEIVANLKIDRELASRIAAAIVAKREATDRTTLARLQAEANARDGFFADPRSPEVVSLLDDPDLTADGHGGGEPLVAPPLTQSHEANVAIMVAWFLGTHEDPACHAPFVDGEYLPLHGEPTDDVQGVLESSFPEAPEPEIAEATAEIQTRGFDWAPAPGLLALDEQDVATPPIERVVEAKRRVFNRLVEWDRDRLRNPKSSESARVLVRPHDLAVLLHALRKPPPAASAA